MSTWEKIIFMKCAQIGGTEVGNNWIGCVASMTPGPMLMVMPTDDTVKRNSKVRIDPMIKATPILSQKIKASNVRDGGNTLYSKDFPGGFLLMTGANSSSGLRSLPIKNLFLDEVDAYPIDLDGEGSPIDLAIARTTTFPKKKIYIVSTPTLEDTSVIAKEYAKTDQQHYHVPCPHCKEKQKLEFENLKWDPGDYEHVYYKCSSCLEMIEEYNKTWMLDEGEWKADFPELSNSKVIGFHINGLYSPLGWLSWREIAKKWDDAQGDEPKLRSFDNIILGKTYKQKGEQPDWNMLYNKRETYKIGVPPKDVCFLTAGVDIQKDRIEIEIVGWAKGKRSYSVDYIILPGETNQIYVWNELAKIQNKTYTREDGVNLTILKMCVDTGYNTQYVYDFCRRFDLSVVVPVKGQDKQNVIIAAPRAVDISSRSGKKIGTFKVWNIGVSLLKSELYGWVRLNKDEQGVAPPGYCFFPEYGHEYFKGLASEQLELTIVKGKGVRKYEWVRKHRQNEALDCRNYARGAASMLGIDRFQDEDYDAMWGYNNDSNTPDEDDEHPGVDSIWKNH